MATSKRPDRDRDGDLFIVRDSEGEDIALGLSARGGHKMGRLGYFFRLTGLELIQPAAVRLVMSDAIYIGRISALKIRNGQWPIIGKLVGFTKTDWPVPLFFQTNIFSKEKEYSLYDDNAEKLVGHYTEHAIPFSPVDMIQAEAGLGGAIFIEQRLKHICETTN